jgi:gas vesicle protein
MHKSAAGHTRKNIIQQVKDKEESVHEYSSYIPIGDAVEKLKNWKKEGAEILYLTSRRTQEQIKAIQSVLNKHRFPKGELLFRNESEEYKDVAERVVPDVLIEDDCESIGGEKEMTITHVKPEMKKKIKSIKLREFEGIDNLPDKF